MGPHWLISSKDDYVGHFYDEGHSQGESNARLIAAAPDLLAALELVSSYLSDGTPVYSGSVLEDQIRTAIAKAKGE